VVTAIVIVYITSGLVSKMSDSFNNENEIDIPEDVLAAASEEEATLLSETSRKAYEKEKTKQNKQSR